jgi:hypothetical protein
MDLSQKNRVQVCAFIGMAALFLSACALSKTVVAGNAADVEDRQIAAPFSVGEELVYDLAWIGIKVGTVVTRVKGIEVINGRDAYVVELNAKTNAFCSNIYPVDDTFTTYIDKEKFVSLKHVVRRSEGRYRKNAVTVFDYGSNKAYFHNFLDGSRKTFDIPGYVQDTLSAAYYFRVLDLKPGLEVAYKVVNNEQVYDLFGIIGKKEFIRLGGTTYETFHVEPYAKLKGDRVEKGKANGYFSCDRLRIPVYGTVKAPLFTKVTAILVHKKEGVRND